MNIAVRRAMTVDEYLAWSVSQSERQRTELINGQIVTMASERVGHNRSKIAALLTLRRAIEAARLPCEVMTDGVVVQIDDRTAYEPGALVYCGASLPGDAMVVPNPMIIVEVLSPTTAHSDTSAKLIGYFKLASVAHYLIIDPDGRAVSHYTRGGTPTLLRDGALHLDPPGIDMKIEDLLGPS